MALTQTDKAEQFRALHEAQDAFVIANVWDGGSARMMAGLGFAALATSSGASAGLLGRRDGRVTRDEALAQARVICDATDLPVSADLEKGFGNAPETVAETIRLAAEAGLVGCSIEDATGNPDAPIFELGHATERIAAAAAAARALPFSFTLTGRSENFLRGRPDLDDAIKRLKAYEAAGADALMAPGLPDLEAVRAVCAVVGKPFNFMVGIKGKSFTVAALAAAGVKRISLATSLYRAAMTGLLSAAKAGREHGTFGYIDASLAAPDMYPYGSSNGAASWAAESFGSCDRSGQPDPAPLNPDPSLRQRPLCGLTIIWGLQPDGPSHWTGGWLYDPKDGVTYDVTAELTASNTLSARIYRGVRLFGRTEILIRDPQLSFDGRC